MYVLVAEVETGRTSLSAGVLTAMGEAVGAEVATLQPTSSKPRVSSTGTSRVEWKRKANNLLIVNSFRHRLSPVNP